MNECIDEYMNGGIRLTSCCQYEWVIYMFKNDSKAYYIVLTEKKEAKKGTSFSINYQTKHIEND